MLVTSNAGDVTILVWRGKHNKTYKNVAAILDGELILLGGHVYGHS
jgi:hypothetical protein